MALFTDIGAPLGTSTVTTAQAAVSVSFSLFYNELGSHGDWVRYNDAYVFVPVNVSPGWRPYTYGHWVYTEDYGWTWVSDEPFGWATYHYGRWGYSDDIGWYWVPGTRWAPAWVSWRRDRDHVVWAPLPPGHGDDVSISISIGDIPDYYWVAVPTRSFLSINLHVNIIDNDRERRRIVQRAEFLGTPRVRNNIVVNNVIDVNVIEKETGKKVRPVKVRKTDNPKEARATKDQVTAFQGEVKANADSKPPRVKEVAEVRKSKQKAGGKATQDNAAQPDQDATDSSVATGNQKKTKKKVVPDDTASGTKTVTPDTTATDSSTNANKRKKRITTEQKNQSSDVDNADTTGTVGQPDNATVNKKKRKKPIAAEADQSSGDNASETQSQKRKKRAVERSNNNQPEIIQSGQQNNRKKKVKPADEQAQGQANAKKKGKNKQCDPQTDPNCIQ